MIDAAAMAGAALAADELRRSGVGLAKARPLPEPKSGPQKMFAETTADIAIYGGHAGGGKTWALIREAMKYHHNGKHRAVLFRRTSAQSRGAGGLWEESMQMFREFGAVSRESPQLEHVFPSGARVTIGHMQHEKDRLNWLGAQAVLWGFDQVETFTETMFWYVALSRSRSMSGARPYIRATANPVPPTDKTGGWLSSMLMKSGYVDAETGRAIPERSGVITYFLRADDNSLAFYPSEKDALDDNPWARRRHIRPRSFTFIEAKATDNVVMLELNPDYLSNLAALPKVERERLLDGNWKISSSGGGLILRKWLRPLRHDPSKASASGEMVESYYSATVRAWDLAATKGGGDGTASAKIGRAKESGRMVIRDSTWCQESPAAVRDIIARTMIQDGPSVAVRLPQDPGQAGKDQGELLVSYLRRAAEAGMRAPRIIVKAVRGSKTERGRDFCAEAEPARVDSDGEVSIYGGVDIVMTGEAERTIETLHHFDGSDGSADDLWDACCDAYNEVVALTTAKRKFFVG